ncbi:MAG TPA: hypothetical protein VNN12_09535 [Dehalococcoidia bacterium]|nr:hypothetical protein [Dehalococcoidia bacterium]
MFAETMQRLMTDVRKALDRLSDRKERQKPPRVRQLTPDAIVRRVKMGQAGVTCCLDHFGRDGPEAFSEGSVIYINRDHPLFIRNSRRRETHLLHVTRLLAQEISLMKDPRTPRQAFERQSKILRDAFTGDGREDAGLLA